MAFQIQNSAGTSNLFVADTANTRIGIGTNAPSVELHVVGNARITGLVSCDTIKTDASGNLSCSGVGNTAAFTDTTTENLTDANVDLWDGTYANLTPNTSTNTILVSVSAKIANTTNSQGYMGFTIRRAIGSNPVCTDTQVGGEIGLYLDNSLEGGNVEGVFVDSPASTGNVRYTLCSSTASESVGASTVSTPDIRISLVELGADLAENYYTKDDSVAPGDIVSIDSSLPAGVKKTTSGYDSQALGIISTAPGGHVLDDYIGHGFGRPVPLALKGRVPVKVSTINGPIKAGDYITSSSIAGVGMRATQSGFAVAQAMTDYSGTEIGAVLAFVNVTYYSPSSSNILQGIDSSGNGLTTIQGSLTVGYDLNIGGIAYLTQLSVSGNASFSGDLVVGGTLSTKNIVIAGHIITSGEVPIGEVLAASITNPDTNLQQDLPTLGIEGNDTSGTINLTSSGPLPLQPGDLLKVNFKQPYSKKPKVFINPANLDTIPLQIYKEVTKDYFIVKLYGPLPPNKTYSFDYFVVE